MSKAWLAQPTVPKKEGEIKQILEMWKLKQCPLKKSNKNTTYKCIFHVNGIIFIKLNQ